MHIVHQGMGRRIAFGPAAGVAGPEPNGVVRAKTNWLWQALCNHCNSPEYNAGNGGAPGWFLAGRRGWQ